MSNYPKFKRGDKVETGAGTACTILGVIGATSPIKYMVEYDHNSGKAEISEDNLRFRSNDLRENADLDLGDKCPKCHTSWKKTCFGNKTWLDCLKCNDTAENLVKKYSWKKRGVGRFTSSASSEVSGEPDADDLYDLFEKMLDSGVFY